MKKSSTEFIDLHTHGCIACWRCVDACPARVIGRVRFLWHKHAVIVDSAACIGCKKCVATCPQQCFASKQATKGAR